MGHTNRRKLDTQAVSDTRITTPRPGQPFALLASEWLTVRVHDVPALESYTRAWAQACAIGARILRTAPMPFAALLRNARDVEAARQYAVTERSNHHRTR